MKKLLKKLRSNAGETLVELMAAILVFTFASILLFSMITAATNINRAAKESDAAISSELKVAEQKVAANKESGVNVSVKISGTVVDTEAVDLYRKDASSLYSYSLSQ